MAGQSSRGRERRPTKLHGNDEFVVASSAIVKQRHTTKNDTGTTTPTTNEKRKGAKLHSVTVSTSNIIAPSIAKEESNPDVDTVVEKPSPKPKQQTKESSEKIARESAVEPLIAVEVHAEVKEKEEDRQADTANDSEVKPLTTETNNVALKMKPENGDNLSPIASNVAAMQRERRQSKPNRRLIGGLCQNWNGTR